MQVRMPLMRRVSEIKLKRIPFTGIIATVEEGTSTSKLPLDKAEELGSRVCGVPRRAKPPEDNMTKEQRKELVILKKNTNLLILPAEKGRATVLMKGKTMIRR